MDSSLKRWVLFTRGFVRFVRPYLPSVLVGCCSCRGSVCSAAHHVLWSVPATAIIAASVELLRIRPGFDMDTHSSTFGFSGFVCMFVLVLGWVFFHLFCCFVLFFSVQTATPPLWSPPHLADVSLLSSFLREWLFISGQLGDVLLPVFFRTYTHTKLSFEGGFKKEKKRIEVEK